MTAADTPASVTPPGSVHPMTPRAALRWAFSVGRGGTLVLRCERCQLGMLPDETDEHDSACPALTGPDQEEAHDV